MQGNEEWLNMMVQLGRRELWPGYYGSVTDVEFLASSILKAELYFDVCSKVLEFTEKLKLEIEATAKAKKSHQELQQVAYRLFLCLQSVTSCKC